MITIHDGNWAEFAEKIQARDSRLCGALPRKSECGKTGYASPYAEAVDLIPKSQYEARYSAMVGKFARQRKEAFGPKLHYQGQHPLCWAYSFAQHIESAGAKAWLPYVHLAPESLLGSNGYRDIGGFLDKTVEWAKVHGIAPRSMVPQYSFNHKSWEKGWEQEALNFVVLEVFDLGTVDMEDECMTALLNGDAIYFGANFIPHAMNYEEIQKEGNNYNFWTPNTWGEGQDMLIKGSRRIPTQAFVVRAITYRGPKNV